MARTHPILTIVLAVLALALAGSAQAKAHHHKDGQQLVSAHIKTNGEHVIDKHGKHTATAQVVNGKIAGIKVKHSEKGDVTVKKVKTFFFSSRRRHTRFDCDWSSDVCSSD